MTAPTADIGSARLTQLAERLDAQEGYAEVVAALQAGHGGALGGVWGSSCALVAASLARQRVSPVASTRAGASSSPAPSAMRSRARLRIPGLR